MLFANPHACRAAYPPQLQAILNVAGAQACRRMLARWDLLTPGPTPLRPWPRLAQELGVGAIAIKDESGRSPLGSFKVLGAPAALVRLVQRRWPQCDAAALLAGRQAGVLLDLVVISATDGNHGRALAAAARSLGCRCVIVLHAQVSHEREQAIAGLGAQIVRVAGNYDDSVREAARLAHANGWQVVSDTSYPGYEEIPRDVMQGYAVIADELPEGSPGPFTHVFLQGGVGGLAAGVASHLWERHGAARPTLVVVEPEQADCLLQSARAGRPAPASGSVDSLMAGLACGEASPLAWRFLAPAVDFFQTVSDDAAAQAMRLFAHGAAGDVPVLARDPGARELAALGPSSRILLINTEGATAPDLYAGLTGVTASAVLRAQSDWLHRH